MKSMCYRAILFTLFISLLIPCASANSAGINFVGVTHSGSYDADTNSVAIHNELNLIASSYSNTVEFHDMDTLELVDTANFVREIYDVEFSPNGVYLAISLQAQQSTHDSIQIMNLETGSIKSEMGKGNDRQSNIDWSPNSDNIIAPNMNNGAHIYNIENMSILYELTGQHVSDITCVKYSKSGNYIVTGDEFGTINIWNSYGEFQDISFDVNEEVTGCDFSQLDAKLAIITSSGNLPVSYTHLTLPTKRIV